MIFSYKQCLRHVLNKVHERILGHEASSALALVWIKDSQKCAKGTIAGNPL